MLLCAGGAASVWFWLSGPSPHAFQEVAPGIQYACQAFDEEEVHGLLHLVTVELSQPGIELYVTPCDAAAQGAGWQYRTRWLPRAVRKEHLTVAINGTLFEQNAAWWAIWPGELARSLETVVADYQINHIDQRSFLLWFADDLVPHLEKTKPPSAEALGQARWGIAGQMVLIDNGKVTSFANHQEDSRTAIGISRSPDRLYLAVFDSASEHRAGELLAAAGATDAILVDGGSSSCLVFGSQAKIDCRRMVVPPRRAHATVFGVRAGS